MKIIRTHSFKQDYKRLSSNLQHRLDKKLEVFVKNPSHPSLRVRKMEGKWGRLEIWEASVTSGYRFTFKIDNDIYYLRRVGPHDILRTP